MILGYARVSTDGQTLDAQLASSRPLVLIRPSLKRSAGRRPTDASYSAQSLLSVKAMCSSSQG
jgi:hypothetical protein